MAYGCEARKSVDSSSNNDEKGLEFYVEIGKEIGLDVIMNAWEALYCNMSANRQGIK